MKPDLFLRDEFPDGEAPYEAAQQGADAWLCVPGAHCGLWWSKVPALPGRRMGCVGAYAAVEREAGRGLLEQAVALLGERGVEAVVGPMNGNTWRPHRLVVESDGRPPFFLEPRNPEAWVEDFRMAGFSELATYSSSEVPLTESPDLGHIENRLAARGIQFRSLDRNRFGGELERIFAVCLEAFAQNYLYTPLEREEFLAAYGKMAPHVRPELVALAEREDRLEGFLFALPDLAAVQAGREPSLILKTLAVRPKRDLAGLGSVLVSRVQAAGRRAGFRKALHVMQHENNASRRLSSRFGDQVFRRYALFAKEVTR
ncbi:MAG: GNAT family N-acetyltransferase [Verrucomicrobiota bacterium]